MNGASDDVKVQSTDLVFPSKWKFHNEEILFHKKPTTLSSVIDFLIVFFLPCSLVPLLLFGPITFNILVYFPNYAFLYSTIAVFLPIFCFSFYLGVYRTRAKWFFLTNYRIAMSFTASSIVSIPYTNVEMRDWNDDGLQFWFTPNKTGGCPHISVSNLSVDEKRKIQELFLQGQARNLDDFTTFSYCNQNFECMNPVAHLVQDKLPFLWVYKPSRYSHHCLWVKVFSWGLCSALFLIGVGPAVMFILGVDSFSIWLVSVIVGGCWLFALLFSVFFRQLYFAVTDRELLTIETGIRGNHIQTISFDKVFPMYSSRNPLHPLQSDNESAITRHSFQTPNGLTIFGPNKLIREEIIFRKYLDTLKGTSNV